MDAADRAVRAHRHLRRYVLDHERAVFASRLHWATLLEPILTTVAATVVVALLHQATDAGAVWVLWLLPAGRLALKWLEWNYQWFVATDKRLVLTYGFVVHKVAMMPLMKVTDMSYTRTPLGQMLGYGRFVMESAGQDQALSRVDYVPDPDVTYRKLTDTIFFPRKPGANAAERPRPAPPAIVPVGQREPRPTTAELPVVGPPTTDGDRAWTERDGAAQSTRASQGADHVDVAPFPQPDEPQERPRSRSRLRGLIPTKRRQDLYEPPTSSGAGPTVPDPFL
ncbi:PH domain-containing protein [Isoptericola sp. S6320L]|uniref:PH domain-containing protein n=1 Tax=Isoptericola sp. S6320L TaxID=2926411 RepID=UPI001FF33A08|nr:PH domain-containing protein [Isoptericola sp. S6320L]MCK0117962.1 PH domain-containing protein [Isoptericola sp. S6320L]